MKNIISAASSIPFSSSLLEHTAPESSSVLTQEDRELLSKFGFSEDKAMLRLRRLRGEITEEEEARLEEMEEEELPPSQRGDLASLHEEYSRMGIDAEYFE